MASKDTLMGTGVDKPVYTWQDVQVLAHIASVNSQLDSMPLVKLRMLLDQAKTFNRHPALDRALASVTLARQALERAKDELIEATNDIIAKPHQIADIQRGLDSGPWQGGDADSATYPNGVPVDPTDLVDRAFVLKTRMVTRDVTKSEPPADT